MDFSSSWINTSLDLNINPRSRVHEQAPVSFKKYEVENNFFSLGMSISSAKEEVS